MPAGPCVVCGITNYSLSVGGPSICPSCDCGRPAPLSNPKKFGLVRSSEAFTQEIEAARKMRERCAQIAFGMGYEDTAARIREIPLIDGAPPASI